MLTRSATPKWGPTKDQVRALSAHGRCGDSALCHPLGTGRVAGHAEANRAMHRMRQARRGVATPELGRLRHGLRRCPYRRGSAPVSLSFECRSQVRGESAMRRRTRSAAQSVGRLRLQVALAIRTTVKAEGLTTVAAARKIGVNRSELSRLMNSHIKKFGLERLVYIALTLGIRCSLRLRLP